MGSNGKTDAFSSLKILCEEEIGNVSKISEDSLLTDTDTKISEQGKSSMQKETSCLTSTLLDKLILPHVHPSIKSDDNEETANSNVNNTHNMYTSDVNLNTGTKGDDFKHKSLADSKQRIHDSLENVLDSDVSDGSVKRSWKWEQNPHQERNRMSKMSKCTFKEGLEKLESLMSDETNDKFNEELMGRSFADLDKRKEVSVDSIDTTTSPESAQETDGSCSYSSFIHTSSDTIDDDELTVTENRNNKSDKDEDSYTRSNEAFALNLFKRRKRICSQSENEQTPKRQNPLFNPLYSKDDTELSPIAAENDIPNVASSSQQTPMIFSKFDMFKSGVNIVNSTPLVCNDREKFSSKRSILKFDRIDTSVSSEDSSGLSKCMTDDIHELISELTAICEDGMSKDIDIEKPVESNTQQLSKIDVQELIVDTEHEIEKTLVESQNKKTKTADGAIHTKKDQLGAGEKLDAKENFPGDNDITVTDNKCEHAKYSIYIDRACTIDSEGRFKNVETTISKTEGTEEDHDDVDVLRLDDLDSDGFMDEKSIAMLSSTGMLKGMSDLKGKELDIENSAPVIEIPDNISDYRCVNITSVSDKDDIKEVENGKNILKKESELVDDFEMKVITKSKHTGNLESDDSNQKKPNVSVEQSEKQNQILMSEVDTSKCILDDKSEAMRIARIRWNSNGVPDQNVNLTVATTFRKRNMSKGQAVRGALEGDRICCLEMYEDEMDKYQGMKFTTVRCMINRLYSQKNMLDNMRYNAVQDLRMQMNNEIYQMKQRHGREKRMLRFRQNVEMTKLLNRFDLPCMVKQNSIMLLTQDFLMQQDRMQAHHRFAYHRLCSDWNDKLHFQKECYLERAANLEEQIQQVRESCDIDSDMEYVYGPPVMVTVRKAPGKDTGGKHTNVTMCLSARIAQAVSLEDDVYDHFYSYK